LEFNLFFNTFEQAFILVNGANLGCYHLSRGLMQSLSHCSEAADSQGLA
jgi:hypothetical protein